MFNAVAGSVDGPPPAPPDYDPDVHGHDFSADTAAPHASHAPDSSYLAASGPPFYPALPHDIVIREGCNPSSSLGWGPPALVATSSPNAVSPYERQPPASLMPAVPPFHANTSVESALPLHVSQEAHNFLASRPPCAVDHVSSASVGTPSSPTYLASPPASMQAAHMANGFISASPSSIDHWAHGPAAPHTPSFPLDDDKYVQSKGGVQTTNVSCPTAFASASPLTSHCLVGAAQPVELPSTHARLPTSSPVWT